MTMRRLNRNERGSSLLIALAFLALFSLWLSASLASTESGLQIQKTLRVEPTKLYTAEGAIEQAIQRMRYDEAAARWDDADCDSPLTALDPAKPDVPRVHVDCEPDPSSGLGEAGESSPPIGIIGLSNGAFGEHAYQQYGNSIVRIDGGVFSNTPALFKTGNNCSDQPNCQQLNLCPRNEKTITDGVLVRNLATVTSLSARFVPEDVGAPIVGNGIPVGTTIAAYNSPISITMSNRALSSRVNSPIRYHENYPQLQSHCRPRVDANGVPDLEEMKKGRMTAVPRAGFPDYPVPESCDQNRIVALQFNCDSAYVADPDGVDKNYPVDKSNGFATRQVPTCPVGARIVELQPGRYTNAAELSALTTSCDAIIWFTPGAYYFDFANEAPVWTIGATNLPNLTVVGGAKTWDREPFTASVSYNPQQNRTTVTANSSVFKTSDANAAYINAGNNLPYKTLIRSVPLGGLGRTATFDGPPTTMNFTGLFTVSPIVPGRNPLGSMCDPTTNVDHAGVEFIFGGQSRMVLNDGKTEICSPVSVSSNPPRQQIAIYGVKANQNSLRAQSGCITAQPYTPGGGGVCPMILAPQGSKPSFIVHGTLYAPAAAVDLTLQNVSYQVVSRGIIARVVAFSVSPSAVYKDALIYSPNFDSVPGAPRKMTLTACLHDECPEDGSDANGTPRIRAVVRIKDTDEHENPGVAGYKVFIDSWSVI